MKSFIWIFSLLFLCGCTHSVRGGHGEVGCYKRISCQTIKEMKKFKARALDFKEKCKARVKAEKEKAKVQIESIERRRKLEEKTYDRHLERLIVQRRRSLFLPIAVGTLGGIVAGSIGTFAVVMLLR